MKKLLLFLFLLSIQAFSQQFYVISHRGGALLAPENTLAAFQNSVELGADYYELDVRMSSDDSLVVMHDATINRTTNGLGNVSSMTFDQLRVWDAGSWFGAEFTGEKIPLLSEALDIALSDPNGIGVVIELKSTESNIVQKVVELVQQKNMQDRVIISSFTFSLLTQVKALDPTIAVQAFTSPITLSLLNDLQAIGAEWGGTGSNTSPELLDSAHAKNIKVNRWTINSISQIRSIIEEGYDAVSTDNPLFAVAALDSTAPTPVTLNTPEVLATKVKLTWSESSDEESGVSHYEIYRSETPDASELIASVNDTYYLDDTFKEETTFYYRVRAFNFAGMPNDNYSNEEMITTGADTKAPKVETIAAYGLADKVIISFNEKIDKTSAEEITNYGISDGITISGAEFSLDSTSVILTTSEMTPEMEYTLSLINIMDLANNPNSITDSLFLNFTYNSYLSDVIGAWDLDEGTGGTITDHSGMGNDGTIFGDLEWSSGYTGNGIQFDGVDDYVEIPASPSLDINGDKVSVSLWTKLAYLPADLPTGYGPLYDSDTDNYVLYQDRGNNELRFKVTTSGGAERPGIPGPELSTEKWVHVVGVYDGATAAIYLDGEMMDSHDLTGTVKAGQIVKIGNSSGSMFEGAIDNIQVFNKALSTDEVAFLYNGFASSFIDEIAPEVTSSSSIGANNNVFIEFSEEMDKLSAELVTNYNIDNGITVENAKLSVDKKSVILTTSELAENIIYTVTLNEIKDLADIPNSLLENTETVFTHKSFPSGLISYWSFDEGVDTFANDWNNINNGSLKNGPEWTAGKTGNSLRFDGIDDMVEVPNSVSLDIDTNAVSISLWVMLDYLPADQPLNIGPLFDSSTDNYVVYVDRGNNELRFKVTTTDKAERPGIPGDTLTTGEWLNVTAVYNGTQAKIFLNGMLMDSHNITGNVKPGQVARIGSEGNAHFSGQIDNIQVYNKGLTDQEVAFLYSGMKTPMLELASVEETVVNLTWNDVHDPLLGLSGFNVYRDTTSSPEKLLTFVKDTTAYSDQTRSELTTFYYRVQAIDGSGNPSPYFSNDIMVTTEADLTAPALISARTTGEQNKVFLNFDEVVDSTSALLSSNYSINNSVTISDVKMSANSKNVILTVSDLTVGENYDITISNIKDNSVAGNMIEANTQESFLFSDYYESLVSFWPLDEVSDTTTFDLFGTNNGFVHNSPALIDGRFGNAMLFDGIDDYVVVPNSTSLDMQTEGVTVSVWVNLNYLPTEMPTGVGPIYDAPQDRYVIYEDRGNKELRFKVSAASGAERPGIPEADLVKGEWQHVVGVYDGTQALIYLNGEQKDVHPGVTGLVKDGQTARIGQDGSHYFNGGIDNLQIYNRGLTPEEVIALYNGDVVTDIEEIEAVPATYSLSQNYPNPFNPSTKIRFSLAEKSKVELEIYNVIGQKVGVLINSELNSGSHEVEFSNSKLSSGIYLYRLKAGDFVNIKKMILLK